ncbi:MAG: pilus assembly protein TadG-related protein [Gammaproteobacteria bacterium]
MAQGIPNALAAVNNAAWPARPHRVLRTRQQGSIAVISAICLLVIIGLIGFALDLARVYNRRVELKGVANAAALAAARQLNGSAAGIAKASAAAAAAAATYRYNYGQDAFAWSDAALQFSSSFDEHSVWLDAAAAASAPGKLFFARVRTDALAGDAGVLETVLIKAMSARLDSVQLSDEAVAGRSSLDVAPLAICAMSSTPAEARVNPGTPAAEELVEYGFRRGVGYNLLNLNPNGAQPEHFLVNPIAQPGAAAVSSQTHTATVAPFICTGSLWLPTFNGGELRLIRPFPMASLYPHFNARFDDYSGGVCKPRGAPPDVNIKAYAFNGGAGWMAATPAGQGAAPATGPARLWTVADPSPAPGTNSAASYGPLWAYAKAVPFARYSPGASEPAAGYATFGTGSWSTLYSPGAPVAALSYPTPGQGNRPYWTGAGAWFQAPSSANRAYAQRNRRVLNIPLLACPVGAGTSTSGTVLAIGRFFMTVPATSSALFAEFAGVIPETAVSGMVELYK